jgi:hypothetical protein
MITSNRIKITIFWVVIPWNLITFANVSEVRIGSIFRVEQYAKLETSNKQAASRVLRNFGGLLPNYTGLHL